MSNAMIKVKVADKQFLSNEIVSFILEPVELDKFPDWSPGAHVEVEVQATDNTPLNGAFLRQYSLCSDYENHQHLQIAVLGDHAGRGGSLYLHEKLNIDDELLISPPRNHFPFTPRKKCLFIAGGIGITPIISMIKQADKENIDWKLIYLARHSENFVFREQLEAYGTDRIYFHSDADNGQMDLASVLNECDIDTSVYSCGPQGLLDYLESLSQVANTPWELHIERFSVELDQSVFEGKTFDVIVQSTGDRIKVSEGVSILDALRNAGYKVRSSCQSGTCGSCETEIISGVADHRDSILSKEEREDNETMMICVSRSLSDELILDL